MKRFLDRRIFSFVLFTAGIVMLYAPLVSAQWISINSGVTENLSKIKFTNNNVGFAAGYEPASPPFTGSVIVRTTNQGYNWSTVYSSSTNIVTDLFFPSPARGYATTASSGILKSINGGSSWNSVSPVPTANVTALHFINNMTGFAGDDFGRVYKTTDGGITWSSAIFVGSVSTLESFTFFNNSIGIVTGHDAPVIAKTTDGGITWNIISSVFNLNSVYASSANFAYAVGHIQPYDWVILKSSDQGNSWATVSYGAPPISVFHSIYCPSNNVCYAVGDFGVIVKSTDGGATWVIQNSPTTNNLNSIYCTSPLKCYIAGDNGTILKTTTGGRIDNTVDNSETEDGFTLYPNPVTTELTISPDASGGQLTIEGIDISDVLGQSVFSRKPIANSKQQLTVDVSELKPGIYFVTVTDEKDNMVTRKIVKM